MEYQSINRNGDNLIKWKAIDATDVQNLNTSYAPISHTHASLALANGINKLTLGTVNDITPNFGDSNIVLSSNGTTDIINVYNSIDRSIPQFRIDPSGSVFLFNDLTIGNLYYNNAGNQIAISSGVYIQMDQQPTTCISKYCLKMGGMTPLYNNATNGIFFCVSALNTSLSDLIYYEVNRVQQFKIDYLGNITCNNIKIGTLNGYLKSTSGVVTASSTIPTSDIESLSSYVSFSNYSTTSSIQSKLLTNITEFSPQTIVTVNTNKNALWSESSSNLLRYSTNVGAQVNFVVPYNFSMGNGELATYDLTNGRFTGTATSTFATASHAHSTSDITSGILPLIRGGLGQSNFSDGLLQSTSNVISSSTAPTLTALTCNGNITGTKSAGAIAHSFINTGALAGDDVSLTLQGKRNVTLNLWADSDNIDELDQPKISLFQDMVSGAGASVGEVYLNNNFLRIDNYSSAATGIYFGLGTTSGTPPVKSGLIDYMTILTSGINTNTQLNVVSSAYFYTSMYVKEASNQCGGLATLVAGTITVSTNKVTANSRIQLTSQNVSGTEYGNVRISSRSAGVSFTITAYRGGNTDISTGDTSSVAWLIIEPF